MTKLVEFEKTMDNIGQYLNFKDLGEIGLSSRGEVFMNKDLSKMVKLTKEKYGFNYVYVSTNGVLFDKEKVFDVLESGLDSIKFSINAISRERYLTVHGKDDFDLVLANLRTVLLLKKNYFADLKVIISCVSDEEVDEYKSFFKKELNDLYEYLDDIWKYDLVFTPGRNKNSTLNIEAKNLPSCSFPFDRIFIDADCHLVLCCLDYFKEEDYGSLLEVDFFKLWNSDRFRQTRNMHKKHLLPKDHICYKCLNFDKNMKD